MTAGFIREDCAPWVVNRVTETVSAVVAVAAAVVASFQLLAMRWATKSELLREALSDISCDEFRRMRRIVYSVGQKSISDWTADEVRAADHVGFRYSRLGFLIRYGYLPRRAFIDQFGIQFERSYECIEPFVNYERVRLESETQWIYFEWLARISRRTRLRRQRRRWWRRRPWWQRRSWQRLRVSTAAGGNAETGRRSWRSRGPEFDGFEITGSADRPMAGPVPRTGPDITGNITDPETPGASIGQTEQPRAAGTS